MGIGNGAQGEGAVDRNCEPAGDDAAVEEGNAAPGGGTPCVHCGEPILEGGGPELCADCTADQCHSVSFVWRSWPQERSIYYPPLPASPVFPLGRTRQLPTHVTSRSWLHLLSIASHSLPSAF